MIRVDNLDGILGKQDGRELSRKIRGRLIISILLFSNIILQLFSGGDFLVLGIGGL